MTHILTISPLPMQMLLFCWGFSLLVPFFLEAKCILHIIQKCDQNLKLSVNQTKLCAAYVYVYNKPKALQINLIVGDPLIKGTIYAKYFINIH